MTKKPQTSKDAAEKVVKNIRRKTRQTYSAEEKIRIGPVALSCRPCCSFKPPFVRMRQGFSSLMLNGVVVDCRSR
jgi:hypothetical protein